jgi:hypothetical protein
MLCVQLPFQRAVFLPRFALCESVRFEPYIVQGSQGREIDDDNYGEGRLHQAFYYHRSATREVNHLRRLKRIRAPFTNWEKTYL